MCCQLYTFRRFPFFEALDMIARLGFKSIEPCFFLKLDAKRPKLRTNETLTPEQRKELKTRMSDKGILMTQFYAKLGQDDDANRRVFDFAKEMGVQTFVSEPPAAAFDALEKRCDEYKINLAIHNHPKKADGKYKLWRPEGVLELCEGRGKRIGACCDTGHWVRSGLKPVECLKKMKGRIITMHLKDVGEWGKPKAKDVILGTGLADYDGVLKELHSQGYKGVMSLEYEHDSPKLVDDVAACVAFVEKTAGTIK
jgi:sugar phosphate isomerase/epimerase